MSPSTDLVVADTSAYIAMNHSTEEVQAIIADNLGGSDVDGFDLTRLKVPSGGATTWEMDTLEGTQSFREIEGIIVHQTQTRSWWPVSLDDSTDKTPPSCSSADARTGLGKIWATAADPDPDGDPRQQACGSCPHAQWGSGKNGGQACQLKGQWFLLQPGNFLPIVVTLPAMSLKPAKKYMLGLAGSGIRYSAVITKLKLVAEQKGANKFAVVTPSLAGRLSPEDAAKAAAYGELLKPLFERSAQSDGEPPLAEAA